MAQVHALAIALILALPAAPARAYALLGTKWDLGVDAASSFTVAPGSPGSATWSLMPAMVGLDAAILNANPTSPLFDPDHPNPVQSSSIGAFLGNPTSTTEEATIINAALNVWATVSGFTNLGMVTDSGAAGGAPNGLGGNAGDIRIGAFSFHVSTNALAGTFRPGTETLSLALMEGQGGSIGGDLHLNSAVPWVDEANDDNSDADVDFFTLVLHELGHALGLGHSTVANAVMSPTYGGGRRALTADDIAGIQAIYGPSAVPEPGTLALMCLGVLALALGGAGRRARSFASAIAPASVQRQRELPSVRLAPSARAEGMSRVPEV